MVRQNGKRNRLSISRRRCLQTISVLGVGTVVGVSNTAASQGEEQIDQWANQNNLSDIAQWEFTPTPGYDEEDSLFAPPYPDTDTDTVYVGDLGGRMHALDIQTGEEKWRYAEPEHALWSTPTVYEETLYFGSGASDDEGRIYAINKNTGEEEWILDDFSGPIQDAIVAEDETVFFVATDLYAVDSETGDTKWTSSSAAESPGLEDGITESPVLRDGIIYINSGSVVAIETETGDVLWEIQTGNHHRPLVTEEGIYAGDRWFDRETGDEIWRYDQAPTDINITSQPVMSDDAIYIPNSRDDSTVHVIDANTGEELSVIDVSGNIRSMLAYDQTVYVGTANTDDGGGDGETGGVLYVIDAETRERIWAASRRNAELRLSPIAADGMVFTAATTGQLFAVEHGVHPFEDDGLVIFQPISEQTTSLLSVLAGAGGIGAAYLGYRRYRSDSQEASDSETQTYENDDEKTDIRSGDSSNSKLKITDYNTLTVGEPIKTISRLQLMHATVENHSCWVLTPADDTKETIDIEDVSEVISTLEPWDQMNSHPNLIEVYGVGYTPLPWAALEQAEYPTLVDRVDGFTTNELIELLQQICDALHHVQRYGTIYHNLTTESVFLAANDTIKLRGVLDQIGDADPWYAAPEEIDGESCEQSTVYRVGLITYELLTGTLPYPEYPNEDPEMVIKSSEIIPPSEQLDSIPAELESIIMKALSRSPDDRHETVLHLRDDLDSIRDSQFYL